MMDGRHQLLRRGKAAYTLHPNALDRIMARGLNRVIQKEIAVKPILPLVNSEAHICCSDVSVSTANVAYGRWAIPKLKKELLSSDPLISKNAINNLLDMVHDPEKAVEAIKQQILPRLVRLMQSEDAFIRQHVLMVLEVLAMQPHGKMSIINHNMIMTNLTYLLSDTDLHVRSSAAKTTSALASWYLGVDSMIKKQFITNIINQLLNTKQDDDFKMILMETLALLLDQDLEVKRSALKKNGMELAVLLEHPVAKMRAKAAEVVAQLVSIPEGKRAMLQHHSDILATLTNLLEDQDVNVKTQAAGALMFALCMTEAKQHCLGLATLPLLLHCSQMFRAPGLQMNAINALSSLAESPEGQRSLQQHIHTVLSIRAADHIVERHKTTLLSVINRVI